MWADEKARPRAESWAFERAELWDGQRAAL